MKFSSPFALSALASSAIMAPTMTSAWSTGGRFFPQGSLILNSPAARLLFDEELGSISPFHGRRRRRRSWESSPGQAFYRTSPRYEIVDNDELFKLAVDVPGIKMEDINVSLEDHILTVSGSRESSNENSRCTSRFSQSFSLDATVDVEKFSANLENGVLVVTAPKDLKRIEDNIRKIPITGVSASVAAPEEVVMATSSEDAPVEVTIEPQETDKAPPAEVVSKDGADEVKDAGTDSETESDEVVDLDEPAEKESKEDKKDDKTEDKKDDKKEDKDDDKEDKKDDAKE
mmetsp:Transcript_21713/g.60438  ORF Transcript_21713/g.60438 Transcript_21713/m.60438 type:complete len:288 (-) Transcript_21713:267-1130(-)|eukprot:CAMPEP_0198112638 /NCGR_PEP_ID=MMETSP1442-20131203/4452_1 /TAXON_ID= /ORGANISM="Craspedostauros australis, Strain CCMP3328" /LENGTH=287 /DNA_ID=CAMNT_0043769485 /DNA_START=160 /DNA_END=1023 /DNA_ORIENTATION=-